LPVILRGRISDLSLKVLRISGIDERLIALGEQHNVQIDLSDEDVVYIDNIYRSRYPAEAGLLPLGEPSGKDAQRAVGIATRILKDAGK
jgi:hypothetical protein